MYRYEWSDIWVLTERVHLCDKQLGQGTDDDQLPRGHPVYCLPVTKVNHYSDFSHHRLICLFFNFVWMESFTMSSLLSSCFGSTLYFWDLFILLHVVVCIHSHCCIIFYYVNILQVISPSTIISIYFGLWIVHCIMDILYYLLFCLISKLYRKELH